MEILWKIYGFFLENLWQIYTLSREGGREREEGREEGGGRGSEGGREGAHALWRLDSHFLLRSARTLTNSGECRLLTGDISWAFQASRIRSIV